MNPPQITLKVIVFLHFMLTTWASMNLFMGMSYMYMNLFVLGLGVFSIVHHQSSDVILMFLVCHVFSILQDVVLLGLYEPRGYDTFEAPLNKPGRNEYRFSLGMSITNLIIKPITAFLVYRIYKERGGSYGNFDIPGVSNIPGFGGGAHTGAYENIDTPTAPPHTDDQHQSYEQSHPQPYTDGEKH